MATKTTETKAVEPTKEVEVKTKDAPRVRIMLPYVEGEDPDQVVGLNGVMYKVRKGEPVDVPEGVAEVLRLSNKQIMDSIETKRQLKDQEL